MYTKSLVVTTRLLYMLPKKYRRCLKILVPSVTAWYSWNNYACTSFKHTLPPSYLLCMHLHLFMHHIYNLWFVRFSGVLRCILMIYISGEDYRLIHGNQQWEVAKFIATIKSIDHPLCQSLIDVYTGRYFSVEKTHMSMFANNALLVVGLGLGFGFENKKRSKEDQR